MNRLDQLASAGTVELQPFEKGRQSLLAAPLAVAPHIQAVLELFDKKGPTSDAAATAFTPDDHRLVGAAAEIGAEMLRQALAQRQTHQLLFDAVAAALGATESVTQSLRRPAEEAKESPPPPTVLDRLREGLEAAAAAPVGAEQTLRLAEAIRVLAVRHGPAAVEHCIRLVDNVRGLLDAVTGTGEARP
jgi:hypothetical protein